MVVGLPSSAAAPAPVVDHEEAQAADGAPELPQLLQPKAQIGAEAREACGSLAQRGGGHHTDPERASRAGKSEASTTLSNKVIPFHTVLFRLSLFWLQVDLVIFVKAFSFHKMFDPVFYMFQFELLY